MNITLTGASGFLGTRLIRRLLRDGHTLHVLGRSRSPSLPPAVWFTEWDAVKQPAPKASLSDADAVIHLAGEPVAQRWNSEVKQRILDSRKIGTRNLVRGLADAAQRAPVLVSASASGYYGDRGDETLVEDSGPGRGFLPEVCLEWEQQALNAETMGIRVATVRIGIVLGKEGGALAQMLPAFKMGAGGRLGSGRQWMSWIHADDLIELFIFAIMRDNVAGAVNGVSPNPVRNADFTAALARVLHRPAIFAVPRLALKVLFGEMGGIVLGSQKILPKAAEGAGFRFRYPEITEALTNLLA
ncbi:MAG: TIGR01777 family oxidoreductase [Bryobacteraceae bacterium]